MPKHTPNDKHFLVSLRGPSNGPVESLLVVAPDEDSARTSVLDQHPGRGISSVLKYYCMQLQELAGSEPFFFVAQADDEEHARAQAEDANPGATVLSISDEALFVVWAPSEESESSAADGFWNEMDGWGSFDRATVYSGFERDDGLNLMSAGGDHQWVLYEKALQMVRDDAAGPKTRLRIVLNVSYDPEGMKPEELQALVTRNLEHAIGNGALTGDSPAMVDQYSLTVTRMEDSKGVTPRVIIEVDGGTVHLVHHNIEGLDYDVLDFDTEGSDDPDEQEERNEELEAEAESLPFSE